MRLKLIYKRPFGKEGFYPLDQWTADFLCVLHPRSTKAKSFSRRQIEGLKKLGFAIDVTMELVRI